MDLCYVWLNSLALAHERVALRVKMGGHNIPSDVIERRYARSIQNSRDLYMPLADKWSVFDNSDINHTKIAGEAEDGEIKVYEEVLWNGIKNK